MGRGILSVLLWCVAIFGLCMVIAGIIFTVTDNGYDVAVSVGALLAIAIPTAGLWVLVCFDLRWHRRRRGVGVARLPLPADQIASWVTDVGWGTPEVGDRNPEPPA